MSNSNNDKKLKKSIHIGRDSIEEFMEKLYLDESKLPESDKNLTEAIRIAKNIIDGILENLAINESVNFNHGVAASYFRDHFQYMLDNFKESGKLTYEEEIKEIPEAKIKYIRDLLHYRDVNNIFSLARDTDVSLGVLNLILKKWGIHSDNYGNLKIPMNILFRGSYIDDKDKDWLLARCTDEYEMDRSTLDLKVLSEDIGVSEKVIKDFLESNGFKFNKNGIHLRQIPKRETDYFLLRIMLDNYSYNKYGYPDLKIFIHHSNHSRIIRTKEVNANDLVFIQDIIRQCEKRFQSRKDKVEVD